MPQGTEARGERFGHTELVGPSLYGSGNHADSVIVQFTRPSSVPVESSIRTVPLSPVVRFAHKRMVHEPGKYGFSELQNLTQAANDGLETDYAALDLGKIATLGDLRKKETELSKNFDMLLPQEQFTWLIRMRRNNHTGLTLLSHTNAYLRAKAAYAEVETMPEDLTPEQLEHLDARVVGIGVRSERMPDVYGHEVLRRFLDGRGELGDDTVITIGQVPDAVAGQIPYREIVLHDALYERLFAELTQKVPTDVLTGEMLIKKDAPEDTITVQEAVRRSTPLPAIIEGWKDRRLFEKGHVLEVTDRGVPFYDSKLQFRNIAEILIPEVSLDVETVITEHGKVRNVVAVKGTPDYERFERMRLESEAAKMERDRLMLTVQRAFFDAATVGLQEADMPLHPDVEEKIRETVLNSISGGIARAEFKDILDMYDAARQADPGCDTLAAFVPYVQLYAQRIGVITEPLNSGIRGRYEEQGPVPSDAVKAMQKEAV